MCLAGNLGCNRKRCLASFFHTFVLNARVWMWLLHPKEVDSDCTYFSFILIPPLWVIRKQCWFVHCLCFFFSSCSLIAVYSLPPHTHLWGGGVVLGYFLPSLCVSRVTCVLNIPSLYAINTWHSFMPRFRHFFWCFYTLTFQFTLHLYQS